MTNAPAHPHLGFRDGRTAEATGTGRRSMDGSGEVGVPRSQHVAIHPTVPPIPEVTVVVATRNRREEVLRTVPRHEAPVVLVDNGSSDGTAAAVRRRLPNVSVVELRRNAGARARTIGAELARTPLVAFADDDSWWAPGALQSAQRIMRDHPRLAVLAAQIRTMPGQDIDPICECMAQSALGREPDLPGPSVLGFVACAAILRRDAFLAVGGFDDVVRFPGEEERVALDIAAAGLGLAYVAEVVAHHQPSPRREKAWLRRAGVTRSRLLTASMRRPWPDLRHEALTALRNGPSGCYGLLTALPRLPVALRHRRPLAPDVAEVLAGFRRSAGFSGQPAGSC